MAGRSRSPQRERGGGYGAGGNGDYGDRRRDDDRYGDRRYTSRVLSPLPILFARGRDRRARSEVLTGATCAVVAAALMTGAEAIAVARVAGSATARRVDLTTGTARVADTAVGAVGAEGVMGEVAVAAAAADSSSSGFVPMRAPALARRPLVMFVHDFALLLGCRVFARAPNSVAVCLR